MKRKIELWDFTFRLLSYGWYAVTYTSPKTGKVWSSSTNDMPLIDATKSCEYPKRCDLEQLKRTCKQK